LQEAIQVEMNLIQTLQALEHGSSKKSVNFWSIRRFSLCVYFIHQKHRSSSTLLENREVFIVRRLRKAEFFVDHFLSVSVINID